MFVIQHISLKDIYMSYKLYVTYMLYNSKQHTNTFQTLQNIYIHSSINCFWPFIVAYPLFNGTTWTRPCGREPEVHLFSCEASRLQI